jgi:glutathione S-transferase
MFRILGRVTSINVRKALWAAAETGLPFRHEPEWGDAKRLRSTEFLALNPNGLIPVLICNEGVLWESNAICRYLAGQAGRSDLLPESPFARAEVEKWMDWQVSELNGAWRAAFMTLVRKAEGFDEAAVRRSVDQWNRLMMILEARLAETKAYVAGPSFTLADVVIGLSLQRWLLTPMERPPGSALEDYRARLQERPAARAWIDPTIA